jgi:hypothetical protein
MFSISVGVFLALFGSGAGAQDNAGISVQPDRSVVYLNTPFYITVVVSGPRAGEPVIPHSDDFRFGRNAINRMNSTSVEIINGRMSMMERNTRVYEATPLREGTLTLPGISATIDGKKYTSDPIQITCVPAPTLQQQAPVPVPAPGPPQTAPARPARPQQAGPQPRAQRSPTVDDIIRIYSEVSKTSAYQGEAVELRLKLCELNLPGVGARYTGGPRLPVPSTDGFYALPRDPVQLDVTIEEIEGLPYKVSTYFQRLFPARSGTLNIGPWLWVGIITAHTQFGPIRDQRELQTNPIAIEVKPLPAPPAGFSGAVGQFTVEARLGATALTQGVPVQYLFVVRGEGNPDAVGDPAFPPLPWAQVSGPERAWQSVGDNQQIEKVFTYTLVPLEPGPQEIPPIDYIFFLPAMNNYKTIATQALRCQVAPSSENTRLVVSGGVEEAPGTRVEVIGQDIGGLLPFERARAPLLPVPLVNTLGIALPPLAYCAALLLAHRRRLLQERPELARKTFARSKTRRRLAAVATAAQPSEELYRAVTAYLADTFNASEAGMTSADAQSMLVSHGFGNALAESAARILKACERARYGAAALSADEIHALTEAAATLMEDVEAQLRARKVRR